MQSTTPGFLMCKPRRKIGLKGVGFQDLACFRNNVGKIFDMELSEKSSVFVFGNVFVSQQPSLSTKLTWSAWAQGVMVPMIQ